MVPTGQQPHQPELSTKTLAACVRCATARRLADLLDGLSGLFRFRAPRDLRGDDDPDELSVLDDRKPPDLTLAHVALGLGDIVVWIDGYRVGGHDLVHRRALGILSSGDRAHDDVAV